MKKKIANWSNPETTAQNEKLPKWFRWVWSMRGLSFGLNAVLLLQITYYCTDMLGLSAGLVGILLMASKIFDAFTDIIAGYLIDRTNSRWGKGRPYDIAVAFMWISTVLLFSAPNFGMVGKAVYVFITYALVNSVFGTLAMVSDPVYLRNAVRSPKNQMSVTSFQGAIIMIGSVVAGMLLPQLIGSIGMQKSGWTVIALIFAVPSAIIGSIRIFCVKEMVNAGAELLANPEKLTLLESLKLLFKNNYALILAVLIILNNAQSTITTAATTYYFRWIFGDVSLASIVSIATLVTPLILIFIPSLSRKIGTGKILKAGFLIMALGHILHIFSGTNLLLILIGQAFIAIGTIPIGSLLSIYSLECMTYAEQKTGVKLEGLICSSSSFAYKVGGGFGSGILGIIMGMSGYVSSETAVTQTATALSTIKFVFAGLPFILTVIGFVVSLFYTVEKYNSQVR